MVQSFHMERLPYIDRHQRLIQATPEQVWSSLVQTLRARLGGARTPSLVVRALRLEQTATSTGWRGDVHVGDTLPGFAVVHARACEDLVLRGRHRFSSYELRFDLVSHGAGCILAATTAAAFPGLSGRAYRALVIGTRGHRFIVRNLLRDVARHA